MEKFSEWLHSIKLDLEIVSSYKDLLITRVLGNSIPLYFPTLSGGSIAKTLYDICQCNKSKFDVVQKLLEVCNLHEKNEHVEAVRLAIKIMPFCEDAILKNIAKRLISSLMDDSYLWRPCGYGLVTDLNVDERILRAIEDEDFIFQYDPAQSIEENEDGLDVFSMLITSQISLIKNDTFVNRLYHDRQFIFTVMDLDHIGGCYDETDNIKYVFPLDELPKDISFPMGHPQANTLYYAHPLRPVYLPFENAQLTLFYEKVQEMCRLFQCLGATKITARCLKGNKVSSNVMTSSAVSAEGGYKTISGTGGVKNQSRASADSETRDEMFMTQTFSPQKAPYCPKDLIWTKADSELQTLIKQRLEGSLLEFSKRVSSYETLNISKNLIIDVRAAFNTLMYNVSANYSASIDSTFSSTNETEWEISVEFKPIEEFNNYEQPERHNVGALLMKIDSFVNYKNIGILALGMLNKDITIGQKVIISDNNNMYESEIDKIMMSFQFIDNCKKGHNVGLKLKSLSIQNIQSGLCIYNYPDSDNIGSTESPHLTLRLNEEKYKEEVLFCLEDGGSISDDDRKYLERKRNKFGISPERAAEIESMCKPQLTEEEQEYLETFKEMTSDGEISDRMRRLLDRERESLGISQERAEEIEHIILKPNV